MSIRNALPFAMIPEWLLDSTVSDKALRLYAVLVRYADKEGHAHPSRRKLAERLHCSPDSVDRVLKELVLVGVVEVDNRFAEGGHQTSNDYILRPGGRMGAEGGGGMDAAPGGASVRHHERKPEELEPSEREEVLAAPRKRDAIWDVLVELYGDPTAKKLRGLNAKILREYGADPDEIRTFVSTMAGTDRDWAVTTPTALVKHFGERDALMAQVTNPRKRRVSQASELMRQALEG